MAEDISEKDELTGAISFTFFQDRIKEELENANRYGKPFSLVRADIDNFKEINERFGFEFGNQIIRQIFSLYKNTTRASDLICREEAEEFVVFLPDVDLNDAFIFSERIRKMVENYQSFGQAEKKLKLTISVGIVTYHRKEGMDLYQLFELLDTTVYQAKQNGRNCIVPYTAIFAPDNFV